MRTHYLPALSSLGLAAFFAGLYAYALYANGNVPTWFPLLAPWLIALVAVASSLVGVGAAVKLRGLSAARAAYVIGSLLALSGIASFYVFNEPTTINVFGLLAALLGITVSTVSSVFIALFYRAEA